MTIAIEVKEHAIITAWLGSMSFIYIILFSKEKEITELKKDITRIPESKSTDNTKEGCGTVYF